jgi:hypothetical protein
MVTCWAETVHEFHPFFDAMSTTSDYGATFVDGCRNADLRRDPGLGNLLTVDISTDLPANTTTKTRDSGPLIS